MDKNSETESGHSNTTGEEPESDGDSKVAISQLQSLDLILDESRRRYDDEEARRSNVENKIGIVVTINALVIAFSGLFSEVAVGVLLIALTPALASAGLGLFSLRPKLHERPVGDIDDFYGEAKMEQPQQKEQLLLDYIKTTRENEIYNDNKFRNFKVCIALTFISLLLVTLLPSFLQYDIHETIWSWVSYIFQ